MRQARDSVALLLQLDMLEKAVDGTYRQKHSAITTGPEVSSVAVRSFHRQMIQHASDALDGIDVQKRYVAATTMGITKECYDVLVQESQAFRDRIINIVNTYSGDRVYQLCLQIFPVVAEPEEIRKRISKNEPQS
jgi:uncharacterized protein (TIGR02147 family)